MIAWAHVLAWPVASVAIAVQARRVLVAAMIAYWSSDIEPPNVGDGMQPAGMQPVGFDSDEVKG